MRLATLLLGALTAAPLAAQGNGVTLLANVDDGSAYNDIWGYTAPDGREYAIIGTTDGTHFYNCTNPSSPVHVGFINGNNSDWRDMKTYDEYCYIVSEGGAKPWRVHVRGPSFAHVQALPAMMTDSLVADTIATLASTDPVLGDVDR